MLIKKKFKKILAISIALSMLFCNNAFATPIDLVNSTESVVTDTLDKVNGTDYFDNELTNEWLDGIINEEVRVIVDIESLFEVTIPKEIVLDGEMGKADYIVNAKGDIAGDQKLLVVPDPNFILSEAGGKSDVTAIVTQPDTEYIYTDLQGEGTEYDGDIAATLTAGEWSGKFNFNIKFEGGEQSSNELPEVKATLNDYTWEEISAISKSGEARTTYGLKVGDTKEMTLSNGETYNAEIIGFNHDDLTDGSGKAGITFQFKEVMTERYYMNSSATNIGGWEKSEMRKYLKDNVYSLLPVDLQNEIKEVNKISDAGNTDKTTLITTIDKLFLLSMDEVGMSSSYNVLGQGNKYEFYEYGNLEIIKKYKLNNSAESWYFRSATTKNSKYFWYMAKHIEIRDYYASDKYSGVCPAFCI